MTENQGLLSNVETPARKARIWGSFGRFSFIFVLVALGFSFSSNVSSRVLQFEQEGLGRQGHLGSLKRMVRRLTANKMSVFKRKTATKKKKNPLEM